MKIAIIILACVAVAFSAPGEDNKDELLEIIKKEVREIIHDNDDIDVDGCVQICDSVFNMQRQLDENATDAMCLSQCQAQLHIGSPNLAGNQLNNLIKAEVGAIIAANPHFTADHCKTQCDSLFSLFQHDDEHATDAQCNWECACQIDKDCKHTPGHHTPGHHGP